MTTWTVVIADGKDKQRPGRTARTLLVSLVALLVLGVGVAVTPHPEEERQPTFSESALNMAYADALTLAGMAALGEPTAPSGVTAELLLSQARALQAPGAEAAANPRAAANPSPAADDAPTVPASPPPTPGELVSALAASAARRLNDAVLSDGGTARLLAAVGTAQQLEASRLAAAWGLPAPGVPAISPPSTATTPAVPVPALPLTGSAPEASDDTGRSAAETANCLTGPTAPAAGTGSDPGLSDMQRAPAESPANLAMALSATVRAEQEAVYVYQVALSRLQPSATGVAGSHLKAHQDALRRAEGYSREYCSAIPPREPGYRLPAAFASAPSAALGGLEEDVLAVYGDLIAVAPADARAWAVSGLLTTARQAAVWSDTRDPLPGIAVTPEELPQLPTSSSPAS